MDDPFFQPGNVALADAPDAAALDAFDALFLVKEKAITDFQQEFQVMCSLGHEVIPNGFMQ